MGLFDNDSDDDEKSFRERVKDIQEQREQASKSTENTATEQAVNQDIGTPVPDDDVQQWEYKTVNLFDTSEAGFIGKLTEQTSGPELPPDEVLNELGKRGWQLVETVERPAMEVGSLADNEGSMTYAFVFRRPVTYQDSE